MQERNSSFSIKYAYISDCVCGLYINNIIYVDFVIFINNVVCMSIIICIDFDIQLYSLWVTTAKQACP